MPLAPFADDGTGQVRRRCSFTGRGGGRGAIPSGEYQPGAGRGDTGAAPPPGSDTLTAEDATASATYIKSLPPIRHAVPPLSGAGARETVDSYCASVAYSIS